MELATRAPRRSWRAPSDRSLVHGDLDRTLARAFDAQALVHVADGYGLSTEALDHLRRDHLTAVHLPDHRLAIGLHDEAAVAADRRLQRADVGGDGRAPGEALDLADREAASAGRRRSRC